MFNSREPQLLADRRLAYPERFSDLPLGHPIGDHRSHREYASQSSDILLTTRMAVLGHQPHKDALSARNEQTPRTVRTKPERAVRHATAA